ncbi:hypothetical protein HRbin30_03344 [bacterium HR30]|nr:hypothetical protein HRbin30_03344 [bacterium HR30]
MALRCGIPLAIGIFGVRQPCCRVRAAGPQEKRGQVNTTHALGRFADADVRAPTRPVDLVAHAPDTA